jgi:hypothetical protein
VAREHRQEEPDVLCLQETKLTEAKIELCASLPPASTPIHVLNDSLMAG